MLSLVRSVFGAIHLLVLLVAAVVDGKLRRPRVGPEGAVWVHRWCKRIVRAMGLQCTVTGPLPTAGAVVSNHLSYLDALMYASLTPFVMVSKTEVRGWPLIGWITAQAGTVYVERADVAGGQTQTHTQVNAAMAEAFRSGLPVLFFPEGTTTDGSGVLPFRRGLFHSVLADRVPMRAAGVVYGFDEPNAGARVGDDVCYWGDMLFGPHLFAFLGLRGVHARVRFGDRALQGTDRFTLAANAHDAVCEIFDELATRVQAATPQGRENLFDRPVEAFGSFDNQRGVRG
jgi:1-acyl-sn-glycerol-3-phosphate acyltransferase